MHYTICTHCVPHLGCIFLRAVSNHGIRIGFADEVGFDELLGLPQLPNPALRASLASGPMRLAGRLINLIYAVTDQEYRKVRGKIIAMFELLKKKF